MGKHLDSGGLSHFMSKIKSWANGLFVKKSGDTMTGGLIAPSLQTGTAAENFFQTRKIRGEGSANTYYHAVDFGYAGHNQVDFHEYGGVYNFYKNTSGNASGGTLLGTINSTGWTGNAATATKLATPHTINVGNKATGTATNFDGSANITIPINTLLTDALREPSIVKGSTYTSMPIVATQKPNKFAFLPADQIIVEKTTDGGATWVDAGLTDTQKKYLFFGRLNTPLAVPRIDGVKNINCGVRITITAMKYDVPSGTSETNKYSYWNSEHVVSQNRYSSISAIYIWCSSNTDGLSCKIEGAKGSSSNTWTTIIEKDNTEALTGWSGGNFFKLPGEFIFGGGTTQTGQIWNWRFTFFTRNSTGGTTLSTSSTTSIQCVGSIFAYGANMWGQGSNMAGYDHLYSWDHDQNAQFPASIFPPANNSGSLGGSTAKWNSVYATTFYGKLWGDVKGGIQPPTFRPTSANTTGYGAYLRYFLATSAMTTGKPDGDGHVLDMEWDNDGKWHGQLSVPTNSSDNVQWRTENGGTWTEWRKLFDDTDTIPISNGGTGKTTAAEAWTALGGGAIGKKASLAASDIPAHASTATTYGAASTSNYGHAKLSSATNSSSEDLAATPKAVKAAYDLATTANTNAGSAMSAATGAYVLTVTYAISNGTVTCSAHVYSAGSEVTSTFADSCFTWSYNTGAGWVATSTHAKTYTPSVLSAFGGSVKCDFTPPSN